jgi:hypothetical protein
VSIYGNARQYGYAVAARPPHRSLDTLPGALSAVPAGPSAADGVDGAQRAGDKVAKAVNALTTFIPIEGVVAFTFGTAVVKWLGGDGNGLRALFWIVFALSLLFYVYGAVKAARENAPGHVVYRDLYFWWKLVAVAIAFVVWAFGISAETLAAFFPGTAGKPDPFVSSFPVIVTATSPILTGIDGLLQPKPAGKPAG